MTDTAVTPPARSDPLTAGRAALARHDWHDAFDLLSRADREGELGGADLESLAEAAFFAARPDSVVEYKERAFKAHLAADDHVRAAFVALDLAHDHAMQGKLSIASGWARRGERLLDGRPETYAHGYLALVRSEVARAGGRVDEALERAHEAAAIAERTGNADLRGWALTILGTLRIAAGAASDGLALLEEASISAVNGELSPYSTGIICCTMISACRDLTDYQRASEWIEATDRYCERQSLSGFPGVCRIHRAEMVALAGAWDRAEQELRRATTELERFNATPPMADGYYALGEIRRLQGDLEGAEAALREAHALGRAPYPALALVRLAQGKVDAAAAAINAAVADETRDQWARARLLPAQAEIAIAAGDIHRARAAAEELGRIVAAYEAQAIAAASRQALGRVLLAEGQASAAATELRAALRLWREVASPYEVARTRALLAGALRAQKDEDGADLELRAALEEFRRLGARPDADAAERELAAAEERRRGPVVVRQTFMFTDIVGSTRLAESLGDAAWAAVLAWHDETIRARVSEHGGTVVKATGDGFFVAFESAAAAVACAGAIQGAIAGTRRIRSDERSLAVRIGLHTGEANRHGDDYSGVAVHVAARVAALAEGGQILATAETLAEAGQPPSEDTREVEVRGVSAPVGVASVSWSR